MVERGVFRQQLGYFRPEAHVGLVEQDQAILGVEQGKAFVDRFDRIAQPRFGRFGIGMGLGQLGIDRGKFAHGLFERAGAVAHQLLQRDRPLEHRKGGMRQVGRSLHPVDQGGVDLAQLAQFAFQPRDMLRGILGRSRGKRRAIRHRPIASPLNVWLTCSAWNCSP